MSGVFTFVEMHGDEMAGISSEVLGAAKSVAGSLGTDVTAVILGNGVGEAASAVFNLGADNVIASDDATLADFRVEAFGPLFASIAKDADVILIGASNRGRDLSAWVSAELDAGVVPDTIELAVEGDRVIGTHPVYAGKLFSKAKVTEGQQILTLRSRAFPPAAATGGSGTATMVDAGIDEGSLGTKIVGFKENEGGISLGDASIIVSGGRGVGGPEGFAPVAALAEAMGGALGSSRAAVDAGWIPYKHQVGQTGKVVSPDLYVACGISGAIQHQAGMRTSKVIVAINKDADAPIFKLADYGIVADLFDIVPAMTEEFKNRLG